MLCEKLFSQFLESMQRSSTYSSSLELEAEVEQILIYLYENDKCTTTNTFTFFTKSYFEEVVEAWI